MPRRRTLLIIAVSLISAILVSYALFANGNSVQQAHEEGIPIGGVAFITVYNSNGQIVDRWSGHNSLSTNATNAIAMCLSGQSTSPPPWDGCSNYINSILIEWSSFSGTWANPVGDPTFNPVAITVTPQGCSATNTCLGWNVSATTVSELFTSADCGTTCTITEVAGAPFSSACLFCSGEPQPFGTVFDTIATSLAVSPGDLVAITIQYSVT